jgi:hypothetical protein
LQQQDNPNVSLDCNLCKSFHEMPIYIAFISHKPVLAPCREAYSGASRYMAAPGASQQMGQRHVNAALGRQRTGTLRDTFAERCVEVAAEQYGREAVSAARDLMVLSVERRWGPA